jgi:hypothetical protein
MAGTLAQVMVRVFVAVYGRAIIQEGIWIRIRLPL